MTTEIIPPKMSFINEMCIKSSYEGTPRRKQPLLLSPLLRGGIRPVLRKDNIAGLIEGEEEGGLGICW